jgi:hypothetical protein
VCLVSIYYYPYACSVDCKNKRKREKKTMSIHMTCDLPFSAFFPLMKLFVSIYRVNRMGVDFSEKGNVDCFSVPKGI